MKFKATRTLAGDISGFLINYLIGGVFSFALGRLWKQQSPRRRFILILTSASAGLIGGALTLAYFTFQLFGNPAVIPVVALFALVSRPLERRVFRYLDRFDPRWK
jgi:hypothetical protein